MSEVIDPAVRTVLDKINRDVDEAVAKTQREREALRRYLFDTCQEDPLAHQLLVRLEKRLLAVRESTQRARNLWDDRKLSLRTRINVGIGLAASADHEALQLLCDVGLVLEALEPRSTTN